MISIFSGGDFRFFWPENISNFAQIPTSWDSILNTGVGKGALGSLWINSYLNFSAFFGQLGLSWDIVGFVFWILPAVLLSFFGAFFLFLKIFPEKKLFGLLSGLIYLVNTYFLMILTGGQAGIALAYSLVPFVVFFFVKSLESLSFKNSLIFGLILSLQVLFDPRIVYITLIVLVIYAILSINDIKKTILYVFMFPISIVVLLHSFWILPTIFYNQNPIEQFGNEFSSQDAVKFFSFANLENSISLLHPNFPENIFGKTYFLKPEFLLLPILAFSSLLFVNSKFKVNNQNLNNNLAIEQFSNRTILLFAIVGLIGAFLAKGANDPFGGVYIWMFNHIPGFVMFRDPTKFYLLIALSYSILIPYSVWQISEWIIKRIKFSIFNFQTLFFLFIILYLLFLVWPLLFGPLSFMHKLKTIPADYVIFKNFLVSQPEFFRTLWIPQWQRFGYFSDQHPAIGRYELFKTTGPLQMTKELETKEELLRNFGVKYVIIPYDSEKELFLNDRKYDSVLRDKVERQIDAISWLKKVTVAPSIAVYELENPKDHFYAESGEQIVWRKMSPTNYKLTIKDAKIGTVVFAEQFSPYWDASINGKIIRSKQYNTWFNSFVLNGESGIATISYKPQELVNLGLMISFVTLTLSLGFIMFTRLRK